MRNLRPLLLLAFALWLLGPLLLPTEAMAESWEVIDEREGISVSRQQVEGSPLVAFRGTKVIGQSLERLLRVIGDDKHRTDWIPRLRSTTVLERTSPYDFVMYQRYGLPFPLSNRDYVFHGSASRTSDGIVTVRLASVQHPKAPPPDGVRANLISSHYRLTPLGNNKTRVEVEIHTDPKGWLPNWIVNAIQKGWPRKTLLALEKETAKPWVTPVSLPPTSPSAAHNQP